MTEASGLDDVAELDAYRDFLRRLFHDLATPLSAANLNLESARRRLERQAGPAEPLERAQAELDRALELVERARELAAGPSGGGATFAFDDAVSEAVSACGSPRLQLRGRTMASARGDRGGLRSALEELLRNALEASAEGVVTVVVESAGGRLRVTVTNPGTLPASDPESLFSPRFGRNGRWGLGLARARLAAARSGGTVTLRPAGNVVAAILELPEGRP